MDTPSASGGNASRPSRLGLGLSLLLGAAVFAFLWYMLVFLAAIACSGDGGVPFAAADSPAGGLCERREGPLDSVVGLLIAGSPLLLLGLGAASIVRRSAVLLGLGFATALVALGLATLPFLMLPGSCSPRDQAAYEAWTDDRSGTRASEPPADCEKY